MRGGGGGGHRDSAKIMIHNKGCGEQLMKLHIADIRLANTETLVRFEFIGRINDKFNQKIFFNK